ncbi:MAG TPA: dipeptide ABC transporter ATP-binding protein [Candidatus Adamsella sp.]|nr:dipeptide ABC transporter ATP-binding protein [Candidatus Adamsella sp.]
MKELVIVKNLIKHFNASKGLFKPKTETIYAVNNISFSINQGETLSLVGESGCGKSTVGKCLIGLEKPTSGEIIIDGIKTTTSTKKDIKELRKKVQIIFQNPYSSLNPKMTVEEILKEPFIINTNLSKTEIKKELSTLLDITGLSTNFLSRYPHEFSGGQRQRIGIARALALRPEFIIADEPVSALDVSVQAQILNLLQDLKKELKLTYLFISHDLSVVNYISDRIAVMYLGEIVETSSSDEIIHHPKHPYTRILLDSAPHINKSGSKKIILKGDLPSPQNLPDGCKFHTRCPMAFDKCSSIEPQFKLLENNHCVKCHLYG